MRTRQSIIFLAILTILNSCQTNQENQNTEFMFPEIKDTTKFSFCYLSPDKLITPLNFIEEINPIGEPVDLTDTTTSNEKLYIDDHNLSDTTNKGVKERNGLTIYVDDSRVVSLDIEKFSFPPFLFDELSNENERPKTKKELEIENIIYQSKLKTWNDNRYTFKGYPVYIVNHTKNNIRVEEQDGRLMMIQEAKDKYGNWKPIEVWRFSDCGNSYGGILLKPKNYLMTKVIAYKGNFETELRLKLLNDTITFYSKPFKGSINISQMDTTLLEKENRRNMNFLNIE
jgi:hypothetical protein